MNVIDKIFDEFLEKKRDIEIPLRDMLSDMEKYQDNIFLYGAGSSGIAFLYFLKRINIIPRYFIDSDESKIGKKCENIEIISPTDISRVNGKDALVIVCINTDGKRYCKSFADALRIGGHHAVYDRLHNAGWSNVIDYTYFRHCFEFFENEKYNAPSCSDIALMEINKREIASVYDNLVDDVSRDTYEKIVRFRLLDDSIEVPTLSQEKQYFEYSFYDKRNDEVFIDCGAFNGISLKMFLKENNNEFETYYALEPDETNYVKLEEYINTLPKDIESKIEGHKKAAWNNNDGTSLYALSGPGSFIADIGKNKIETITIDNMLKGQRASYIKMNIEGSEKEALEGARQTIEKYRPRLAIAGYHRTNDLWEIPQMIMKYNPKYELHLRSYMNHISFVYYGV